MAENSSLTPSELAVARLLIRGHTMRAIATERGVSVSTVKNQVATLREKTSTSGQDLESLKSALVQAIRLQSMGFQCLAGHWVTMFSYFPSLASSTNATPSFQVDLHQLADISDIDTIKGETILGVSSDGSYYRDMVTVREKRGFAIGYWENTDSLNFGSFLLHMHSKLTRMEGLHLGTGSDNSVRYGEWKWMKALDINTELMVLLSELSRETSIESSLHTFNVQYSSTRTLDREDLIQLFS